MGYIFQKLEWKNGIVKIFHKLIYLVTLAFLILFSYSGGIKTVSFGECIALHRATSL
jgi:hypothetical protein